MKYRRAFMLPTLYLRPELPLRAGGHLHGIASIIRPSTALRVCHIV
jgi:hypothetical protein